MLLPQEKLLFREEDFLQHPPPTPTSFRQRHSVNRRWTSKPLVKHSSYPLYSCDQGIPGDKSRMPSSPAALPITHTVQELPTAVILQELL